jgi:hypothetical protein
VKTEDMLAHIATHDHGYHMSDFEAKNLLEFVSNLESLLKIVKQAHENWMIRAQTAEAETEQLKAVPHLDLTQSEVGRLFDALTFADDKEMEITDLWNKLEDYGEARGYFEPKLPEPEEVEQKAEEVK